MGLGSVGATVTPGGDAGSDGKLPVADRTIHKFGANPDMAAGVLEDVWPQGGTYNWLTVADNLRIRAGGNAADDAAGLGAQSVFLVGLAADFTVQVATLTTAGIAASGSTASKFIRLIRAFVVDAGTYTGTNTGEILLETDGGILIGCIDAGLSQTQISNFTIPVGAGEGLLSRVYIEVVTGKPATIYAFIRENADDVIAPFTAKRIIMQWDLIDGVVDRVFDVPFVLPPKTDIWFSGIGDPGGGGSSVTLNYSITLTDASAVNPVVVY